MSLPIPPALLATFPPSSERLLDVTRRQVDDSMLEEMAAADHGINAAVHLTRLRPIRDDGTVSSLAGCNSREVLELVRWSNPVDPTDAPGCTGRRSHQMRAFACAALLRENCDDEAGLAQCLISAKALDPAVSDAAGCFLTWSIPRTTSLDLWLFGVGLLVVATRFRKDQVTDQALRDAIAWVFAEEAKSRGAFGTFDPSNPRPEPFGLTGGFWKPIAAELIGNAVTIRTDEVRGDLELIASILCP